MTSESALATPPCPAATTIAPRIKAPSSPEARAQRVARPVSSGRVAKTAHRRPATDVAAPESPIKPPTPRSLIPTALTTTCRAIASPAYAASTIA